MQEQASTGFWLSPQQEFVFKSQPSAALGAVCVVSVGGPVSADRLRECVRELLTRHEILLTVYRRQAGLKVPFQVVLETAELGWETKDVSGLGPSEYDSQIRKLFHAQQTQTRDLEDGPVLSALLVTRDPKHASLILSLPAVAADAESFKMLTRELALIYSGKREQLPEP